MQIADVLRNKGSAVATITPDATVRDLLAGLAEHNIGAMVVADGDRVHGIASERDVARRLHQCGAALLDRPVAEIMTALVATCAPGDQIDDLSELMTEKRVRHIPVLDDGRLAGIVSIGDVVKTRMEELHNEREQLHAYITGG
ncbi:histidine kinase [Mycolicibacillus koreensis]|nr:histidine kinase [Mycolicibacillus koreensis]